MILDSLPLSKSVSTRVNPCLKTFRVASWLVSSLRSEMPNLPIPPILPQPYFLCVLGDLCGVRAIMQNKPNSPNHKTNVTHYGTQIYSNIPLISARKNKPNQTQLQPKTRALLDPERSRRANQTQFGGTKSQTRRGGPDQTQFSSAGKTWQKTTQINKIRPESPHKTWGRKAGSMRSRKVQECWERSPSPLTAPTSGSKSGSADICSSFMPSVLRCSRGLVPPIIRAASLIRFPHSDAMQFRVAEFSCQPFPRKYGNVLDCGVGPAEVLNVEVQVLVVQDSDKLVMDDFLEVSYRDLACRRRFDGDFNNVVMPVPGRIGALAEDLEIPL